MLQVYLDMDGVIADFVGGSMLVHGISSDKMSCSWDYWTKHGIEDTAFWIPIQNEEFWENLPVCEDGIKMLELIEAVIPRERISILSSADRYGACEGKRKWLNKHLPHLRNSATFSVDKFRYAAPNKILIDDSDTNLEKFKSCGGIGVRIPRPWNQSKTECSVDGSFDPKYVANVIIRQWIKMEADDHASRSSINRTEN